MIFIVQAINKQSQTGEELKKPVSPTKIYLCDLCNTYYENLELLWYVYYVRFI